MAGVLSRTDETLNIFQVNGDDNCGLGEFGVKDDLTTNYFFSHSKSGAR